MKTRRSTASHRGLGRGHHPAQDAAEDDGGAGRAGNHRVGESSPDVRPPGRARAPAPSCMPLRPRRRTRYRPMIGKGPRDHRGPVSRPANRAGPPRRLATEPITIMRGCRAGRGLAHRGGGPRPPPPPARAGSPRPQHRRDHGGADGGTRRPTVEPEMPEKMYSATTTAIERPPRIHPTSNLGRARTSRNRDGRPVFHEGAGPRMKSGIREQHERVHALEDLASRSRVERVLPAPTRGPDESRATPAMNEAPGIPSRRRTAKEDRE